MRTLAIFAIRDEIMKTSAADSPIRNQWLASVVVFISSQ